MTDMLQEFCDSRGASMRVDAQAGVIRGVKVLGLESRNGRTYLPETLAQAARLYEDAKVNVNHPKGNPAGPRDYQDRIGTIRGVAMRAGEGLFGDFHFNPKHALAEQLIWDAEHAPENVGFSHNVEARTSRRGDRVVVEAILRVQSVDLVADPATTRGLFESAEAAARTARAGQSHFRRDENRDSPTETAKPLSLDDLKRDYPELVESIGREQAAELSRLRQEVERLAASEAASQKRDDGAAAAPRGRLARPRDRAEPTGRRSICGGAVPRVAAGRCPTSGRCASWSRSARDWCGCCRAGRPSGGAPSGPQSREQHLVYGVVALDAKSFVEAIT